MRPSDGFEVVPPAVRAERAAIVKLAESTRDAHNGLQGMDGAGGAIGYEYLLSVGGPEGTLKPGQTDKIAGSFSVS